MLELEIKKDCKEPVSHMIQGGPAGPHLTVFFKKHGRGGV